MERDEREYSTRKILQGFTKNDISVKSSKMCKVFKHTYYVGFCLYFYCFLFLISVTFLFET